MKIPTYKKIAEEIGSSFAGKVGKTVKNMGAVIAEDAETVLIGKRNFKLNKEEQKLFDEGKMSLEEVNQRKEDFENSFLGRYKLSKTGWGILAGVGAMSSLGDAYDTYNADRMGTPGGIANNTPEIPYTDNGGSMAQRYGAGGDLVFAMNRNRRG